MQTRTKYPKAYYLKNYDFYTGNNHLVSAFIYISLIVMHNPLQDMVNSKFNIFFLVAGIGLFVLGCYSLIANQIKKKKRIADLAIHQDGFSLISVYREKRYYWKDIDSLFADDLSKHILQFVPFSNMIDIKIGFLKQVKNYFYLWSLRNESIGFANYNNGEELREDIFASFNSYKNGDA